MACFLLPLALAIATTILQRTAKRLSERLRIWILNTMLWGGVVFLGVEHLWMGEFVPWPPFLTAMANPASTSAMLHEILTVGSALTAATVAFWGLTVLAAQLITKTFTVKEMTPADKGAFESRA